MEINLFPILQPRPADEPRPLPLCREAAWDFVQGKPLFKNGEPVILTGSDAVKTWVYKALLTQRGRYEIYTHNFGSDVESLTGQNYTLHTKRAEAIRYVREALEINPYIDEVGRVEVDFHRGDLSISASVTTIYGGGQITVSA